MSPPRTPPRFLTPPPPFPECHLNTLKDDIMDFAPLPKGRLPEAVYEGLRVAAFKERRKIHDIVLEGIELALRKRARRG
jgi:hypothetical protein